MNTVIVILTFVQMFLIMFCFKLVEIKMIQVGTSKKITLITCLVDLLVSTLELFYGRYRSFSLPRYANYIVYTVCVISLAVTTFIIQAAVAKNKNTDNQGE